MFCSNCGVEIADNSSVCMSCGVPAPHRPHQTGANTVPNNLVGSILVTLLCCQIFGIISIVYAAQVNSKLRLGDINGAVESSNKSKKWIWWGFGIGLVGNILYAMMHLIPILMGDI